MNESTSQDASAWRKLFGASFQVMMYDNFSPAQLAIVFSISATHLVMTLERVGLISKK